MYYCGSANLELYVIKVDEELYQTVIDAADWRLGANQIQPS